MEQIFSQNTTSIFFSFGKGEGVGLRILNIEYFEKGRRYMERKKEGSLVGKGGPLILFFFTNLQTIEE